MPEMRLRPKLRPRPRWGSLQRSPDSLAGFKGSTSKGRGGEGMDGGMGGKGEEREGAGRREGEGGRGGREG